MKFRKKPVVIDAVRLDCGSPHEVSDFVGSNGYFVGDEGIAEYFVIKAIGGDVRADDGDWIIKGVEGEFYPCKPDIFAATHEAAE